MAPVDHTSFASYLDQMIVPPKEERQQLPLRLPPTLVRELDEIALRTNRSRNQTIEMLLMWAVQRSQEELAAQERAAKGKKK